MLTAVGDAFSTIVTGWIPSVLGALDGGALAALLPLFAIGIAVSAVFLGIKVIRSVVWGA